MPDPNPRKNQKQIAQRYAGNRRYFGRVHAFRFARFVVVLLVLVISAVLGLVYLESSKPVEPSGARDRYAQANNPSPSSLFEVFNTSGPISQSHAKYARTCEVCHDPAIKPNLVAPAVLTASLDAKCEVCHTQHTFHQPNVVDKAGDEVVDTSCVACHHEHTGAGPMQPVADLNCTSCHGSSALMTAAVQKATYLPASDFVFQPADKSLTYFTQTRPKDGYTQVFQSFENGHPDFQIQREHESDPNTLKFNHKVHLGLPNMICADCHKPDSQGAYMQPISFAANCQSCHKLQIDPTEPNFQIPHPSGALATNTVRDFLLDLPVQYRSYAIDTLKLTDRAQIDAYVAKHMAVIRQRTREGADLATEVFESDPGKVDFGFSSNKVTGPKAVFQGCVYCHEVKTLAMPQYQVTGNAQKMIAAGEYEVTPPQTPDRWYIHAQFDHSKHITVTCEECHAPSAGSALATPEAPNVLMSEKTSDINIPNKASCVVCHSTKGGVVSSCTTCHNYHNKAAPHDVAAGSAPAMPP